MAFDFRDNPLPFEHEMKGHFIDFVKKKNRNSSTLIEKNCFRQGSPPPGRNISQIFSEIFSDFLRNFFKNFLRFSVGFGTLMRKWEIFPKHLFSTVFRNCSPILFLNSQRFPHQFSNFLRCLNKTLTYRKAKNDKFFQNISKDFLIFFDFLKIVVSSVLLDSTKIRAIQEKYEVVYIIFQISSFSDFLIIYGSKINNH